jgi:hypothetical protein
MTDVIVAGEGSFGAPGQAFADYGPNVPPGQALVYVKEAAKMLLGQSDLHPVANITRTFGRQDGRALEQTWFDGTQEIIANPVEWVAGASFDQLQKFSAWMGGRHRQLQQSLTRDQDSLIGTSIYGLLGLQDAGLIDERTVHQTEATLRITPFRAMSSFEAGANFAAATCAGDRGRAHLITMANLYEWPAGHEHRTAEMGYNMLHEGLHGKGFNTDTGFAHGLTGDGQPTILLEEIVVAHLQAVGANEQPEIMNPAERYESVPVPYTTARGLMASLDKYGLYRIPPDLQAEAWLTPLDDASSRRAHPRNVLERRLKRNVAELLPGRGGLYGILRTYASLCPLEANVYLEALNLEIIARATGALALFTSQGND